MFRLLYVVFSDADVNTAQGAILVSKSKPVTSKNNKSRTAQANPIDEELVDKLSDMLSEMLNESADFQEFESATLELGNELVRRTLKKN